MSTSTLEIVEVDVSLDDELHCQVAAANCTRPVTHKGVHDNDKCVQLWCTYHANMARSDLADPEKIKTGIYCWKCFTRVTDGRILPI